MRYDISERYGCVVIEFKGKMMGGPDATDFNDDLHQLIDEDKKQVVADLSKVSFMNSSGLGILIGGLTTMRNATGDLRIAGAGEKIESLLVVTKLITVFDNYRTVEEAVKSYQDKKEAE